MNTPSNAVPESPVDPQGITPAALSPTRPFYWSVRRELWENRSIYIAPLTVAALFLFGFLISTIHLPDKMRAALALDPVQQHKLIEQPYTFAALLIMATTFIVGVFYCLDALYGERRDRSILFWKSLPVSDLTTVLSKAIIPILVLPLLTFAITVATQLVMLLLSTAVLLGSGLSIVALWTQVSLFQTSPILFYHLLVVHGLYYAPIYGWLLLVSGWARRAAFLWAGLPLLAIGVVEKIAFNTSHFAAMLGSRLSGGGEAPVFPMRGSAAIHPLTHFAPLHFLSSPGLWLGLVVTAAFLAAAVRLRRYREPI
ncbi:MAG TPA: ABC transporter permease [Thermoanaerobaculia bacterium]|jgi:ABC-2 type transport system permease protein|nr:ABC transporter permease [Thermoanaerobaculia bacterium]